MRSGTITRLYQSLKDLVTANQANKLYVTHEQKPECPEVSPRPNDPVLEPVEAVQDHLPMASLGRLFAAARVLDRGAVVFGRNAAAAALAADDAGQTGRAAPHEHNTRDYNLKQQI